MRILNKMQIIIIVLIIVISTVTSYSTKAINTISNSTLQHPIKIGVLLYSFDEPYLSELKKDFETIQKGNPNKVEFSFFDGKSNPAIQYEIMKNLLNGSFDVLALNIFETDKAIIDDIVARANQKNVPLVIFISTIPNLDIIKNNPKLAILSADLKEPAALEGKILADAWNADKKTLDKNGDNILQYIMLKGKAESTLSNTRTKYTIESINKAGIKTEELATVDCNWSKDVARESISSLFLKYGPKIEAIIANNANLAIGAIEALQQYGYNKGNKSKTIPVVGISALPDAQELIKKGYMLGSVFDYHEIAAEAIYNVSMNLATGKSSTEGTNYKISSSGITIPIPYQEYTIKPFSKTD